MIHFQKRNLRIEKVEEAKIYLARNDLNTDTGKTFLLKTQKFGRTGRDIDDTSFAERTERIRAVGSDQLIRIMDPPAGGLTAVETVVVIRSKPFLLAPHIPRARESDQQKDDMYQAEGHTRYRFTLQ